ncbi:uncharacterized protein LOC132394833 [Hypanus sabinus]|uniref:uncharacterized protein LOC132394833 n=1 Tax=Hypanus sabinus TaxID=79690 RepID=UPI0028C48B67|nr:uncharacterized protein LOC132394833 [Hypanus sabinus]
MASKRQVGSWTEEAICPVCLDFFTDPVSLECGHSFCRDCIERCWGKEAKTACPECRERFKEIILKANRALMRLADKARELNLSPSAQESELHCEEHAEELKLFCETDKKLLCLICRDAREHKFHNFMPIKEAVEFYKDQVKSSLMPLTARKSEILRKEQQQKEQISEIRGQSRSLELYISSEFTKMHQKLTEKEQRLIRDLKKQEERAVDRMERHLREIQKSLTSIEEEISILQKQMEQKDEVTFLKEESCRKRRDGDDRALGITEGALTLEKLIGPLPLPVWREMFDDIHPVSVTLDVETAGPGLEMSEDRKSVRWTRTLRDLPDGGKRFTACPCVLGSEGFTSGRHYWEVEVAGNWGWGLGVAAESVERKGWVELSPETGFWIIGRVDDGFNALTSTPSRLPTGPIPGRVAVYLSYESGTVSFYNAETKSHLYTFSGNKFTGNLYPFLETWDESWLKICSLYINGSGPGTTVTSGAQGLVNMASKQQDHSWIEEATCPICLDLFTDPVLLECGHNFCRLCITHCWEREARNICPECREEFQAIILKVNRALMRLAEKARKLELSQPEKESQLHCDEHGEKLKLFCETDKTLICLICRDSREHKFHYFMPIKEAVEIYKAQVKSFHTSLIGRKLSILKLEEQQKQAISQFLDQSRSLESHISSEFTRIHQSLTEKEQRLISDLREQEGRVVDLMEKNLRSIQEKLTSIEKEISMLQQQMEQKDAVMFLKEESCWKRSSVKLCNICRAGDEQTATVMDGALTIDEFAGPLPFPVWREMLDDIHPVSVTLDVETAAPELEISVNLKSVRVTGTRRDLPDNRKRFTNGFYILGSEGFTTGRHYWEVKVAENQGWSLGVATESVERKRNFQLTPENGVWAIGKWGDQFYALTSPRSRLPAGPIPGRLGVYLSYESGTVSFYNTETKSHLHIFTGNKFTEKLYPFFVTWDENQWLRICSSSSPVV